MVDRLRHALEELQPPICPNCHIEMSWYRSALVAPDTIKHLFQCPNCHRAGETTSKLEAVVVPPDRLAAPAFRHVA
jgi:hypothetical protein